MIKKTTLKPNFGELSRGAITVLSDVDDEWDEMMLKLTSALQAFK